MCRDGQELGVQEKVSGRVNALFCESGIANFYREIFEAKPPGSVRLVPLGRDVDETGEDGDFSPYNVTALRVHWLAVLMECPEVRPGFLEKDAKWVGELYLHYQEQDFLNCLYSQFLLFFNENAELRQKIRTYLAETGIYPDGAPDSLKVGFRRFCSENRGKLLGDTDFSVDCSEESELCRLQQQPPSPTLLSKAAAFFKEFVPTGDRGKVTEVNNVV